MPATTDGLRYPHTRVLLPRTRLAYVHLANLLSDAKRDRTARVFGYVAIWLEKELVVLYLQEGQVVNATATVDGRQWLPVPIREAIAKVPAAPEFGAICFHEAPDEQLACMYWSQVGRPEDFPKELAPTDATALLGYLMAQMYDGMVEVLVNGHIHYVRVTDGMPVRGYFGTAAPPANGVDARLTAVLAAVADANAPSGMTGEMAYPRVRRFPVPPALPVQAPPTLIAAYRELMRALVDRLVSAGQGGALQVAEQARLHLSATHPVLQHFALDDRVVRDPVIETRPLSQAMAAWTSDVLWGAGAGGPAPEQVLADVGRDRRHLFQSAGYWDALPWRVTW